MNRTTKLLLSVIVVIVCAAAAAFAPALIFDYMDTALTSGPHKINSSAQGVEVLASDIPLTADVKEIFGKQLTADVKEIFGKQLDVELNHEQQDVLSFLKTFNGFQDLIFLPQNIKDYLIKGENLNSEYYSLFTSVQNKSSMYLIEHQKKDALMKRLQLQVDNESEKIVSLSMTHFFDLSSVSRQQIMSDYITYLGLDILGDWEYNGNRYYSKKARFYVNAEIEDGSLYIGIEII